MPSIIRGILKKHKASVIALALLVTITVGLWLPTITIPYWWDSAGYVVPAARRLVETNFWPLIPGFTDFAHPPLFVALLAFVWQIFGESLFISHAVNLMFTLMVVIFIYLLGRHMVTDKGIGGSFVGFSSALLLLVSPVFLAQVGIIYVDIPLTAFALASTYFYMRRQYLGYAVCATLMVLTKEIAVVLCIVFAFASVKKEVRTKALVALPLIVLAVWFVYHFLVTGWWLMAPGRELINSPGFFNLSIDYLFFVIEFIFLRQKRFLMLIPVLLLFGLMVSSRRREEMIHKMWRGRLIIPVITVLMTVVFAKTEFLLRYSVLILPFLYLASTYSLYVFFKALRISHRFIYGVFAGVGIVGLFAFSSEWDTHRRITSMYAQPLEDNLEYIDVIKLGQKTAAHIRKTSPDARIYTTFPFRTMLSDPSLHYVDKAFHVSDCSTYKKGDTVDVVIVHPYSPYLPKCQQIVQSLNYKTVVALEENGKVVNIVSR